MRWLVIVLAIIAVIVVVVWFAVAQHPERAASHHGDRRNVDAAGRGAASVGTVDRPAGADAENMAADPPGGRTPPGAPDVRPR